MDYKLSDKSSAVSDSSLLAAKNDNANILPYRKQPIRWLALLLISLMIIGCFYIADIVSTLETQLKSIMGLTNLEYAWLNAIYSFPCIITNFFSGALIDKYGARKGIICSTLILIIGQVMLVLGCYSNSYSLLFISQGLCGIGGYTCIIAKVKMISIWFDENEFAHALGWTFAAGRFGEVLNSLITPRLYNSRDNLFLPTFGGLIVMVLSFIAGIGIIILDLKADTIDKKNYSIGISDISTTSEKEARDDATAETTEDIGFKSFRELSGIAWSTALIYGIGFGTGSTFFGVVNDLLQKRFVFADTTAGEMVAIVFLISTTLNPFTGVIINFYGHRIGLLLFSLISIMAGFGLLAALPSCNACGICYLPIILLGIFMTIFPITSYSCMRLAVPQKLMGLITGVSTAILNLSQAVFSLTFGAIADATIQINQGYFWSVVLLVGLEVITTILVIDIRKLESKSDHGSLDEKRPESIISAAEVSQ